MINSSQRLLPDNAQQTNIHAPGGIRTHDLSRRAAPDLRLRPRGHLDRLASNTGRGNSTVGIRNFNLRSSSKEGEDWFESLLIIHTPLSPVSLQFIYLRLFNSVAKRKLFLGRKNIRPSLKLRLCSPLRFYENAKY